MIFPDVPKRYSWNTMRQMECSDPIITGKTPLHGQEEPTGPSRITVEEWWIRHGLAADPAALTRHRAAEPVDWWGNDAWEFYALCLGIVCWIVYWYGVHHGAW